MRIIDILIFRKIFLSNLIYIFEVNIDCHDFSDLFTKINKY